MHCLKIALHIGLILLLAGCGEDKKEKNFRYFRNYSRTFNDLNDRHLSSARKLGVNPLASEKELKKLRGKLKEVESCRWLEVDKLTHSYPYLVPEAYDLLKNIALTFKDSLNSKGLPSCNLVVTSVLRTSEKVTKLRKRNVNASANSAHVYGTTFDIAYARYKNNTSKDLEIDKMKSVLAEILDDLRKKKRCYVKYEYKQGCFHITAR